MLDVVALGLLLSVGSSLEIGDHMHLSRSDILCDSMSMCSSHSTRMLYLIQFATHRCNQCSYGGINGAKTLANLTLAPYFQFFQCKEMGNRIADSEGKQCQADLCTPRICCQCRALEKTVFDMQGRE